MVTKQSTLHSGEDQAHEERLRAFIADKSFPCVGAKSALNKGRMRFHRFGKLGDVAGSPALHEALVGYAAEFPHPGGSPVSFVALFENDDVDEQQFEVALWKQLQSLHEHDLAGGHAWCADVSHNPERHDFSFSVGGRAYFVVGMHPKASRLARRAPMPCLVFNFHEQFEILKASGKYQSMQDAIRARDVALQGTVNPVLSRFGEASEARQYSGRAVSAEWKCPFHHKA